MHGMVKLLVIFSLIHAAFRQRKFKSPYHMINTETNSQLKQIVSTFTSLQLLLIRVSFRFVSFGIG